MGYLLEDVRVIDAASFLAGPGAATVLADFGADVVKIEPLDGDGYRRLRGGYPVDYNWLLTSRNKRSLALNLAKPEGRGILHELVAGADVMLTNFIGAQLARYELEYERLHEMNPRLVYAHMTGFGTAGPDVQRRAFDLTAWWARSGMMEFVRAQGGPPQTSAPGMGDQATAMSLFGAIMTGLYRRERTGQGSYVSTSLLANGAWSNGMALQGVVAGLDLSGRKQQSGLMSPFTGVYETADGRFVALCIINVQREWPHLCAALDHEDWVEDPRFADQASMIANRAELRGLIAEVILHHDRESIERRLTEHDVTYSYVTPMAEVIDDEQLLANGIVVATGDAEATYAKTISSPINVGGEAKRPPRRAPDIGAQTREILREIGRSEADIAALLDAGVVGGPDGG